LSVVTLPANSKQTRLG